MRVSILSSRDILSNIVFTLSFNVTFGPPSRVLCYNNDHPKAFFNARSDPKLSREVIRSQFVDSSQPDMTRVTVKVNQTIKVKKMYICELIIEGRVINFTSGVYNYDPKNTTTTTVTVTGEWQLHARL